MMKVTSKKGAGRGVTWLRQHLEHDGPDCLIWPFSRDDKGYGLLGHEGRTWKASRLMCTLVNGDAPEGYQAAHSCGHGNLGCVHPKHLTWKTPSENTKDAVRHGHYGFNSGGKTGKLKASEVSEIKALVGIMTNVELGLIYKVHAETIAKIRRGETWRRVA